MSSSRNGIQSLDELLKAFESILETITDTTYDPKNRRSLSREQIKVATSLHDIINAGNLRNEPTASETLSWCDGFITEWEATGVKSAAVQQLVSLLNKPHIRGVLVAAEDVSCSRYEPILPSIPFEVDEDEGIAVKIVRIMKRDDPLGATIRCEDGKVYVARLISGGIAERSACIQEGDRMLEVNGYPVTSDICLDDIVQLISKTDNGTVTFKLIPTEQNNRQTNHTNLHVRAQFDYDGSCDIRQPCAKTAISFKKGDILELLVCTDNHWWQGQCLGSGSFAGIDDSDHPVKKNRVGLIPSEVLQQRTRQLEREERSFNKTSTFSTNSLRSRNFLEDELVYEPVSLLYPSSSFVRPIVLIGPPGVGRNELKRRLTMLFPERFSTTIPCTSRPPRASESNGVDYYFTSKEKMEQMIARGEMLEFGEYRGNLYGTSLLAVIDAQSRGTPLLTPHPLALVQLRTAEFKPFVIFIKPPDTETFMETRAAFRIRASRCQSVTSAATNTTGRGFSEAEIEQIVKAGVQLERTYGHLFDARIVNCNLEDSLSRMISLLQAIETKPSWVASNWATRDDGKSVDYTYSLGDSGIISQLNDRIVELEETVKIQGYTINCLEYEADDREQNCKSFSDSIVMWYKRGAKVMLESRAFRVSRPTTWTVNDIPFKDALRVVNDMKPLELKIKFLPMDLASVCWNKLQNYIRQEQICDLNIHPYDRVITNEMDYAEKVVNLMVKAFKYQLDHEDSEYIEIGQTANRLSVDSTCHFGGFIFSLTGLEQILRACTPETVNTCNRRAILDKILKAQVDCDKPVDVRVCLCSAECTEKLIGVMEWNLEEYQKNKKKAGGGTVQMEYPKGNGGTISATFRV